MTEVNVNAFAAALSMRIDYETLKAKASEQNMKKLQKALTTLMTSDIAELLTKCNVDAAFINRQVTSDERYAIYNIERVASLARSAQLKTTIENRIDFVIFKTMKLHAKAKQHMLQSTARLVLSDKHTFSDDMKALVYQDMRSYDTEKRQSDITLSAMCELNLLTKLFTEKREVAYAVNDKSEIFKRLAANN